MKVLIVEDDKANAFFLKFGLEHAGFEVAGPVATVSEALELVSTLEVSDVVALIDINLQDGSLGTDLARELHQEFNIPALLTTGNLVVANENKDAALGVIGKPYSLSTIISGVRALECLMYGEIPSSIPLELTLFQDFLFKYQLTQSAQKSPTGNH